MTPAPNLSALVAAARASLRRDGVVAAGCAVALVLLTGLVLALLGGRASWWATPSAAPLLVDVVILAGAGFVGWWLGRRWVAAMSDDAVAAEAERERGLPAGTIRGALELVASLPRGASRGLAERAERQAMAQTGDAPDRLVPALSRATRRRARALGGAVLGLAALLAVVGFAAPEASRASLGPLLRPIRHLEGPRLPVVRLTAEGGAVARGAAAPVRVDAPLRDSVVVRWKAEHGLARERVARLERGSARLEVGPIDEATVVWAEAPDGAASDTLRLTPEDPLLLAALEVELAYPAYLGREDERYGQPVPPLVVPEGTVVRMSGRATAPLRAAGLARTDSAATPEVALRVDADRFAGEWRPARSGTYAWSFVDAGGREMATGPAPLDVVVVPDSAPIVRITYPARDTVVPADMRLPLMADVADDHGLAAAELVSWRASGYGEEDAARRESLPLRAGSGAALLRAVLELGDRRLLPGDTLRYYVRAVDASPRRQEGRSATYSVVFPSMDALRDEVDAKARELVDQARELSRQGEELATKARDESRNLASSGERSGQRGEAGQPKRLDSEQSARLEQMASQDEELLDRMDRMREQMESLERAMQAAGLQDPEVQNQLDELRKLYDQALTDELRQQLQELNKGLEELDPEQVEQAMQRLAERQEQLREQLKRSLELFRRAAAEQQMMALADESRDLAAKQEAVSAALSDSASSARGAEEQQRLEEQAADLEQRMGELGEQLGEMGEKQGSQAAASAQQQTSGARQQMQAAQQSAQSGQQQQAGEQSEQAAEQMSGAANQLDQARQQMADSWRQEATQAVQQATQDVLSLAQEQESLRQQMQQQLRTGGGSSGSRESMKAEQAGLQQSLEALGRNLSEAGQRSALVDRDVGAALGRAMLRMDEAQQKLADDRSGLPTQEGQQAVEALNQLAMKLVQNADRIGQQQGGTGLQQALEQMAQMAQQQGQINSQSGALMPLALPGASMSNQLEKLGAQQMDVARGIEEARRQAGDNGEMLGRLDELSKEAEALARQMQSGALPPEARARQERLFHRLLDAGRTLEREETSDQRESKQPDDVAPAEVDALDPALLRGPRYRPPSEEELRGLSPAYRRLILEYFDRLNRSGAAEPADGGAQR